MTNSIFMKLAHFEGTPKFFCNFNCLFYLSDLITQRGVGWLGGVSGQRRVHKLRGLCWLIVSRYIYVRVDLQGYFALELFYHLCFFCQNLNPTKRYGPLHGPSSSSCGGLLPRAFLPFGQKNINFHAVFAYFRPFLVFSSNHSNFEQISKKIQKKQKKI